ncbi:methyltransferase domain-containing protein [Paenibacillus sp. IB182496]|uniref:Methyltransferase domain-containing protein n=1 Tax=Paenibacillus sabuli TaxID=2772509 RepID=A0A927GUH6_9BACL|nr:methyltransferase domain-containing protein [Paenibacillus sabuli]MBD2847712.1 methyltransferase domain-containing protein [Paenibacillus sabuli]
MRSSLRMRAASPELMDEPGGGHELTAALRELRRLNRLLGAAPATRHGVVRLWERHGRPRRLRVLDAGSGGGDVNLSLLRWAEQAGVELHLTLVDRSAEACAEARRLFVEHSNVEVVQADLYALATDSADIVTASQVLHHFARPELPGAMRALLRASRVGVVIGDIHRHRLAWLGVWVAARLLRTGRYVRHDGPLSVARGFRSEDWAALQSELGETAASFEVRWRPLFRYCVVAAKPAAGAAGGEPDA